MDKTESLYYIPETNMIIVNQLYFNKKLKFLMLM